MDQLSNDEGVKVETIPKSAMSPSMEVVSSLSTQKTFSSPCQSHVTYFPASDLRGIFDHMHRLKKTEHLHVKFDNMDTAQVSSRRNSVCDLPVNIRPRSICTSGHRRFGFHRHFPHRWWLGWLGTGYSPLDGQSGSEIPYPAFPLRSENNPNALVLLDELRARQIKFQNPRCDATNREKLLQKIARQQALAYE